MCRFPAAGRSTAGSAGCAGVACPATGGTDPSPSRHLASVRPPAAECASPDDTHTVRRLALGRGRRQKGDLSCARGEARNTHRHHRRGPDRCRHCVCLCRGGPPCRPAGSRSHRAWRQCHGGGDRPADTSGRPGGHGSPARPPCGQGHLDRVEARGARACGHRAPVEHTRGVHAGGGHHLGTDVECRRAARTRAGGASRGRARRDLAHASRNSRHRTRRCGRHSHPWRRDRRSGEIVRGLRARGCRPWRDAVRAHACGGRVAGTRTHRDPVCPRTDRMRDGHRRDGRADRLVRPAGPARCRVQCLCGPDAPGKGSGPSGRPRSQPDPAGLAAAAAQAGVDGGRSDPLDGRGQPPRRGPSSRADRRAAHGSA